MTYDGDRFGDGLFKVELDQFRDKEVPADNAFDVGDEAVEDKDEDFEVVGGGAVKDGDDEFGVRDESYPTYADPWYKDYWTFIVGAVVGLALGVAIGEAWFPGKTFSMRGRYSSGIDIRLPVSVLVGLFGALGGFGVVCCIEEKRAGNKDFDEDSL
ncbi:hypothetical protein R80B4_00486 [Fibrobacteres bacterium R8-0-B4]